MPSYTLLFEDTSPYLVYTGTWLPGSSSSESSIDQYSDSSFTVTETTGSSLSFQFYGAGLGIYGSKRGNHGTYQVTVDDQTFPPALGRAIPDQFNATLFSAALTQGFHNVTLVNKENNPLDIDSVSWECSIGRDDEPLIVNTVQDSNPAFSYTPTAAWTVNPPSIGSFSGSSGHVTSSEGAMAELAFKVSEAIAVYGPVGPAGASSYSARVNTRSRRTLSALKQFYRSKELLFYAGNLGPGTHVLQIKLEAVTNTTQALAIDYAEIYTASSLGGQIDGSGSLATISRDIPVGAIVGLALLSVISILSLGALLTVFIMYKRGTLQRASNNPVLLLDGSEDYNHSTRIPLGTYHGTSGSFSTSTTPYPIVLSETQPLSPTSDTRGSLQETSSSNANAPPKGAAHPSSSIRKKRRERGEKKAEGTVPAPTQLATPTPSDSPPPRRRPPRNSELLSPPPAYNL